MALAGWCGVSNKRLRCRLAYVLAYSIKRSWFPPAAVRTKGGKPTSA